VPVLVARGAGVQSADLQITGAVEEGHPLTDHDEIYALRYATMTGRQPHQNYLLPDVHNEGTDLGYFVWLIRGEAGDILVNIQASTRPAASARSRALTINPADALARFGVRQMRSRS
jgi:hypothetical protein